MSSSRSNLKLNGIKWKYGYNEKCKSSGFKNKYFECCFEYTNVNDILMLYKMFMFQCKSPKKV